jgi:phosphoglycerol transferase
MEVTFTDKASGGAFDESYIPELTQLAKENEDFSGSDEALNGGISLPYTTWTMGAMFGQTSGLPLQTSIHRNDMDTQLNFFPDIWTLGDILEKEGYNSTLLLGSDAVFGGRKTYFETHGNYEIRDYYWAGKHGYVPAGHYVWWGMEDSYLISMAKSTLDEYSAKGEPFNVTMLTVDTHFEDGYVCPDCDNEYESQYSNVMACSSKRIAEFIDWCKEQPWYANTTIVITGDHPTMDTDFCEDVPASYQRKTYTCIINPAVTPADPDAVRVYSTIDLFPTTLAALGVEIEGDRLALGTNLFSNKKTLLERYPQTEVETNFDQRSVLMEKMYKGKYISPAKEK